MSSRTTVLLGYISNDEYKPQIYFYGKTAASLFYFCLISYRLKKIFRILFLKFHFCLSVPFKCLVHLLTPAVSRHLKTGFI